MHTYVATELVFENSQQTTQQQRTHNFGEKETLLYSNEWDVTEKRFYMFGDEHFEHNSPFRNAENKADQAQLILRKLIQATSDKNNGIEAELTIQLQRLVELLRMSTMHELKKIYEQLINPLTSRSEIERHRAEHLMADSLAIAGTRNTIKFLVDKLHNNQLSESKGVQALKNLHQLPAPSSQQIDLMHRLCKSEVSHRSDSLKQTCLLTFGSMVSELCQQDSNKQTQTFGFQSGFEITEGRCTKEKKKQYQDVNTNNLIF